CTRRAVSRLEAKGSGDVSKNCSWPGAGRGVRIPTRKRGRGGGRGRRRLRAHSVGPDRAGRKGAVRLRGSELLLVQRLEWARLVLVRIRLSRGLRLGRRLRVERLARRLRLPLRLRLPRRLRLPWLLRLPRRLRLPWRLLPRRLPRRLRLSRGLPWRLSRRISWRSPRPLSRPLPLAPLVYRAALGKTGAAPPARTSQASGLFPARAGPQHIKLERAILAAHGELAERSARHAGRERGEAVEQGCDTSTRLFVARQASSIRWAVFIVSPMRAISFLREPSSPTATGPQ